MAINVAENYPRLDFRRSAQMYRFTAFCGCIVLTTLVVKASEAITPAEYWPNPMGVAIAWCLLMVSCLTATTRLLSRMDFSIPAVVVSSEGVFVAGTTAKALPWTSISKIRFYEVGQYRGTKLVVLKGFDAEQRDVTITANILAGVKGKDLFETLKLYHRHFGRQPETGPDHLSGRTFTSSSWTGVEDD